MFSFYHLIIIMKGKDKNEMTDVKFIILRAENPDALASGINAASSV